MVCFDCSFSFRSLTESSGDANNNTLALELLGEVDLVAGGVLNKDVQVRDSIALLDEGRRGLVEEGGLGPDAGNVDSEAASGEHRGEI